jgi:hypothetical protein
MWPLIYHFAFRCLVFLPFKYLAFSPFHHPAMSRFHQFTRFPLHHYVFSPMCHSAIPPFRYFTIPLSHHCDDCTIPPFHYNHFAYEPPANPPFGHSIIPPLVSTSAFHRSAILPHHHFANPTHVTIQPSPLPTFQHPAISLFSLFAFAFLPFHHSAI